VRSKPGIPVVRSGNPSVDAAHTAIKQTLDAITGQARNQTKLEPLPATATTAQIIERLNDIAARLQ
jgi:hypothetical protein